jgi:hypothetical protein
MIEEGLRKQYKDLLRDRSEAWMYLEEPDSTLDALVTETGKYCSFADYAAQHSVDRPMYRIAAS